MKRSSVPTVVLIAAVALVALLVYGVVQQQTGVGSTVLDQAVKRGERPAAPARGVERPTLDAATRRKLADLEGQVVVVNFWASWCGPCKSEAPHLNALSEQYADQLTVLGVNTRDPDLVNAQTFARANGLVFPSLFDPDQSVAAAFGDRGPVGMPTTLLLDDEHRVAVRFYGAVRARDVVPHLAEAGVEA